MKFDHGFEIREHKDEPGKFYVLRNNRPISGHDGTKTSRLSLAAAMGYVRRNSEQIEKHPPSFTRERKPR